MPRRDGHVAQDLRDALRDVGRDVSTRQIERLGGVGLLGEPPYGSGLVQRALYAFELVERNEGRLDLAALAMFVERRYCVGEQRLKAAYALALERLEVMIDTRLGPGDPVDAFRLPAATLARRSAKEAEGRELRERVRRLWPRDSGRTVMSLLEDFYLEILLVARTGRASSEQGLREALEGTGVGAIASEHLPGRPPVVGELPLGEIDNLLSRLSFGGVARTVGLASYQELEQGRDDALAFSRRHSVGVKERTAAHAGWSAARAVCGASRVRCDRLRGDRDAGRDRDDQNQSVRPSALDRPRNGHRDVEVGSPACGGRSHVNSTLSSGCRPGGACDSSSPDRWDGIARLRGGPIVKPPRGSGR